MAITGYQAFSRPPLPRNKYGEIDEKYGKAKGTTLFAGTGSLYDATESSGVAPEIDDFVGSTSEEDGKRGLVPAPSAHLTDPLADYNDNVKFLKGDGTWKDIPISRYTTENQDNTGIDFSGKLWVDDTISTQTLNVTGAAHFWELVIDKVRAAGGNIIISPGSFHVDKFIETDETIMYLVDPNVAPWSNHFYYNTTLQTGLDGLQEIFEACDIDYVYARRCYQRREDGATYSTNQIQIGDMVRCKTFNMEDNEGTATNKDYWTFVLAIGTTTGTIGEETVALDYIDLFEYFTVDGSDTHYPIGTICDNEGNITVPSNSQHAGIRPPHSPVDTYQNISEIDGNGDVIQTLPDDEQYSEYVDANSITITQFTFGYGVMEVEEGDELVVLGHLWDGERQGAILLAAYDPLDTQIIAPAICQYKGIRNFDNLSLFRTNQIAANGNIFTGRFMAESGGYLIDLNERLNLFYTDIQTVLETVGIHLDGDHSTIKLVGSVEVRQNGNGDTDTLTVWDTNNIMRVKISPENIPDKSNMSSTVNPTYKATFNTLSGNRPADYSKVIQHHTWKEFIWSWNHSYQYYTDSNYCKFKTTANIGTLTASDIITVNGLNVSILSTAYFKGSTYVSNRGGSQNISSVIVRLKKRGSSGQADSIIDTKNITSTSTITVNAESAYVTYSNDLWTNYTPGAGSYYLELEIQYNVYATITYSSEQPDYYFSFDYSCTASTSITKPSTNITRIGRNGLVFNGSGTRQWFYAGTTGLEMSWGNDALISLDSTYGLKTSGTLVNYSSMSGGQIPLYATIAMCNTPQSSTTVKLPNVADYGIGRVLTVVGNDFITVATYNTSNQKILKQKPIDERGYYAPDALSTAYDELGSVAMSRTYSKTEYDGDSNVTRYHRTHNCILQFMSTGTSWLLLTPMDDEDYVLATRYRT